ncbi:MAG TPA: DUF3035 domain-containing protein, partial [Stellaceae bacterium]
MRPSSLRHPVLLLCALSLAPLGACTDLKRALGMEKVIPDEFAVVQGAPLAIPPDYALRPPRPGAPPSQELSTTEQARQTIFRAGDQQSAALPDADKRSTGENQLLRQAGAANAPRDIRDTVNREAAQSAGPVDESFADKLLFWRSPEKRLGATDVVVNPQEEAQRLKAGQPAAPAAGAAPEAAGAAAPSAAPGPAAP